MSPAKQTRKKWYKDDSLYHKLNIAARKWKSTPQNQSFRQFCKSRHCNGISRSTLNRFIKQKTLGVQYMMGIGRPYKCSKELLLSTKAEPVHGKITTFQITDVFKVWREEDSIQHIRDHRFKRQCFVLICKPKNKEETVYDMPDTVEELQQFSDIHAIVLIGNKHYCYVHVRPHLDKITLYDSGRRSTRTREKRNEGLSREHEEAMDVVLDKICQFSKKEKSQYQKNVAKTPKQDNDIDCGMYALFFADCIRKSMVVKPNLSREDVENYRGRINYYLAMPLLTRHKEERKKRNRDDMGYDDKKRSKHEMRNDEKYAITID